MKLMIDRIRIIVVFFLLLPYPALVSCATSPNREMSNDMVRAENFLDHLKRRDESGLIAYMSKPELYTENGKLDPLLREFLFGEVENDDGWRSAIQIATMGKILFEVFQQENDVVTVLYYPEKFASEMREIEFLRSEWMKKYFACEFKRKEGDWKFYLNVCFFETDGPFPGEYG